MSASVTDLPPGVYPWTADHWHRLTSAEAGRHHAWLLRGPEGVGKRHLAVALARHALLPAPGHAVDTDAAMRNGRLFDVATHPDMHCLMSEAEADAEDSLAARFAARYLEEPARRKNRNPRRVITVDQVRSLAAAVATRPQLAAARAVLITPASAMNANAANALLKLLEEPPPDTVLFLETSAPHRLPATIRSRCIQLAVAIPQREPALEWLVAHGVSRERAPSLLDLAGGAPLTAREMEASGFEASRTRLLEALQAMAQGRGDPVAGAGAFRETGAAIALRWLHGLITDVIRLGFDEEPAAVYNRDQGGWLQEIQKDLNLKNLFRLLDVISQARALLDGVVDEQLLLEDVLIRVDRVLAPPRS